MKPNLPLASLVALTCSVLWVGSDTHAQLWQSGGGNISPDDPRRFPDLADPNDPRRLQGRKTITPQAREDRGLTPHEWTGIVNPDVIPKLEFINQTVAEAKQRKNIEAIDIITAVRFPEKVFVQIQLRHTPQGEITSPENKAAIKIGQRRVLTSLKASEFHVQHLFETRPGIIGYVVREGLAKLGANPDVTGVCLDQEPMAWSTEVITSEDLPPAAPEEGANKPGVAEGKVKRDVYRAFALAERVRVIVALKTESLPQLTEDRSQRAQRFEDFQRARRELIDRVTSTVNADDFWLKTTHFGGMSGRISQAGLQKLWNHPEVLMIGLHSRAKVQGLNK